MLASRRPLGCSEPPELAGKLESANKSTSRKLANKLRQRRKGQRGFPEMGGQLFDAIGGGIFVVVERSLQVIICLPRERERD